MRTLIDTCVIIDALQSREPFVEDAQKIFLLAAAPFCNQGIFSLFMETLSCMRFTGANCRRKKF